MTTTIWMSPASCSGARTSARQRLVDAERDAEQERCCGFRKRSRPPRRSERSCTHAIARSRVTGLPPQRRTPAATWPCASTPSRSSVSRRSWRPGDDPAARSPDASTSTCVARSERRDQRSAHQHPAGRPPDRCRRRTGARHRRSPRTRRRDPRCGLCRRRTTGREPKFPSTEPGPGAATASEPRSMPSATRRRRPRPATTPPAATAPARGARTPRRTTPATSTSDARRRTPRRPATTSDREAAPDPRSRQRPAREAARAGSLRR